MSKARRKDDDERRNVTRRTLSYEPMFDAKSFKGEKYCDKALVLITKTDLVAFTRLPTEAYPGIVKEFYKHFKCSDDTGKVSVKIYDEDFEFNCRDIAKALGLKYNPVKQSKSQEEMRIELMKTPNPKATELRTSSLHEDFWVVDKFIRAFVCPHMTNNATLPQYAYPFWHSLYTRSVIDVPLLVMEVMKVSYHGGKIKNMHGLMLPRTITAILKHLKYQFEDDDDKVVTFAKWGYGDVDRSLKQIGRPKGFFESKGKGKKGKESTSAPQEEEDEEMGDEEAEDDQGFDDGNASNAQGNWDQYMGYQGPPQPTWGANVWTHGPPRSQWEEHMRGQEQVLANQNQMFDMMRGMDLKMDGMQSSLQSLDSRVQGLEDRRWGGEHYQRRRKSTMTIEEEHDYPKDH